jgi:hypothetical protein
MLRALKQTVCVMFVVCCCGAGLASAQATGGAEVRPGEVRVALDAEAVALDSEGRAALAGRLRTMQLTGTPEAPGRNSRFVLENRSAFFYSYAAGWATFYDGTGVRCGEGLWKVEALAPAELAEVDTPGLRLTCTPTTWRVSATNLVTRTSDIAKPSEQRATPPTDSPSTTMTTTTSATPPQATMLPPLEININGKTLPIQPGNPLEITVGRERVRIILNPAP